MSQHRWRRKNIFEHWHWDHSTHTHARTHTHTRLKGDRAPRLARTNHIFVCCHDFWSKDIFLKHLIHHYCHNFLETKFHECLQHSTLGICWKQCIITCSGNTNWAGKLSTVDPLIRVGCFVKQVSYIFQWKGANLNKLVQGGQRYRVFPFSKTSLTCCMGTKLCNVELSVLTDRYNRFKCAATFSSTTLSRMTLGQKAL